MFVHFKCFSFFSLQLQDDTYIKKRIVLFYFYLSLLLRYLFTLIYFITLTWHESFIKLINNTFQQNNNIGEFVFFQYCFKMHYQSTCLFFWRFMIRSIEPTANRNTLLVLCLLAACIEAQDLHGIVCSVPVLEEKLAPMDIRTPLRWFSQ